MRAETVHDSQSGLQICSPPFGGSAKAKGARCLEVTVQNHREKFFRMEK